MGYKKSSRLQVAFALTAAAALAATHTVDLDALGLSIIGGSDTQTDGGSSRTTNYDLDEIAFLFWVSHTRTRTGGQCGPNHGLHSLALTSGNVRFAVDENVNHMLSLDYSVSGGNISYDPILRDLTNTTDLLDRRFV